jgi:hypothetical protein
LLFPCASFLTHTCKSAALSVLLLCYQL